MLLTVPATHTGEMQCVAVVINQRRKCGCSSEILEDRYPRQSMEQLNSLLLHGLELEFIVFLFVRLAFFKWLSMGLILTGKFYSLDTH